MHRSMTLPAAALAAMIALAWVAPARGTEYYYVPSAATPTLQSAVLAAEASAADEHVIFITGTLTLGSEVAIGFDGSPGCVRHLTIRPGPTLLRATILSTSPGDLIFHFFMSSCVTLEDLDILRNITNNRDLVLVDLSSDILIQRCRIGSIWSSPGGPGWSNVKLVYPTRVMLRNDILFALALGTFDHGVQALGWGDPSNSIYLYNNTVADYRVSGISILGPGLPGQLVLLRNNAVANHPAAVPEPFAFESSVGVAPLVVSSHNAVFASVAAFIETVGGAQPIAGLAATLDLLPRPGIGPAFVENTWIAFPPGDPNVDFFRLEIAGPLHDAPADAGETVLTGAPNANDIAVTDDIEKDGRPGGPPTLPLHTDRGADQVDAGVASDIGLASRSTFLWAAPSRNPARSEVGIRYRCDKPGRLVLELFDVAGRRLHREEQEVGAGRSGVLSWPVGARSGVFQYRLRLVPDVGSPAEVRGNVTVIR